MVTVSASLIKWSNSASAATLCATHICITSMYN